MSLKLLFTIIMLLWLVFGVVLSWPPNSQGWRPIAGNALLFVLFLILGYKEFGSLINL